MPSECINFTNGITHSKESFFLKIYLTLFVMIVLFSVAFIFGSQNAEPIMLNYLIAKAEITVASAVSIFMGIGFIMGLLFALLWKFVRAVQAKKRI